MAISVHEFWQLAVASGLLDEESCRRLADGYAKARESGAIARTTSLPDWMLTEGAMTRYQARILLAGRPGPFAYGDYVVSDRLEVPGTAGLFRAAHRPTGIGVCLQFLSGAALADASIVASLAQLAAAAARASRTAPHLTHCHALVDEGAYKFFVIDALPPGTLAERLAAGLPVGQKDCVRIAWQVTDGLAALHKAGERHGAIRPDRIWLTAEGAARLAGFPLSRDPLSLLIVDAAADSDPSARGYAPPESRVGSLPTPAGDVYSLGRTLYQMLSGRGPAANSATANLTDAFATQALPPLLQVNPAVAPPLAALVDRMLAPNPADRFADAMQLAAALWPFAKLCGETKDTGAAPPERATLDAWLAAHGDMPSLPDAAQPVPTPVLINPVSDSATPRIASRQRNPKRVPKNVALIAAAVAALVIVAGVAILVIPTGTSSTPPAAHVIVPPTQDIAQSTPTAEDNKAPLLVGARDTNDRPPPLEPARVDSVVGIDATMWASPTHGPPLDLAYLPPGAQIIVALRPAQLAGSAEGKKLLDVRTAGALAQFIAEQVPSLVAPVDKIEQLLIGFFESADGTPRWSLAAKLSAPADEETLLKAWGEPEAKARDGASYFQKGDRAFYLPVTDPPHRTIVIGPADLIAEEVIPAAGAPPPLRREIEALAATSDADRDLTILAAPSVLLTGGERWLSGPAGRLLAPLKWFLSGGDAGAIEDATRGASAAQPAAPRTIDLAAQGLPKAVLASLQLTDADMFAELRIYVDADRPAQVVAREYRERVARLPKQVSAYIRGLALSDYSHDVLWDFPLMVEQFERHTIVGADRHQAVLRTYLPSVAAHNLALGTHLALLEPPRTAGGPAGTRPAGQQPPPAAAEPLARRLDRKMSLVFDRAPLEKALQMVGEEIDAPLIILGPDLQAEGITKNQSFAMAEREQSAREILRKIMIRANPDGKLVYVIKPSEGGGAETLYITTRAAARQRGDALPAEFTEQK